MIGSIVTMNNIFLQIIVLLFLILLNAFFSMSEISLISINDNKIKRMAKNGNKKAAKIVELTENSGKFLATIQVGVTLSGFLTSASAAQSFSDHLAGFLVSFLPLSLPIINALSTIIITLVLSYFSLVLGELVPKKIAMQYAEPISFKVVSALLVVRTLFNPFILLLSASTNLVMKMFRFNPDKFNKTITEEEIIMMIDVGKEKGVIENSTKNMIINIFDFDNTTVSEVMTHRTEIEALENTSTIQDAVSLAIKMGYSRIPVFKEDLDTIVGIIYVKDLLKYVSNDVPENVKITDIMRPAVFIPETKKCNELFTEMTSSKNQIAIIIDEYGGTEGLVTMEDLLESIVGNIQDEYDNEEDEISILNENTFHIEGTIGIEELSELLEVNLPEGDYDTVAGMLVEKLGRIPESNEFPTVTVNNIRFTVQEVSDHRISKILVEKLASEDSKKETDELNT